MLGILDVGGGLKGAYSSGIYDYLLDEGIEIPYCIGVSAGAANMVSYLSGQRGRSLKFYVDYAFRKEYMSAAALFRKGSYLDLDYIYSTLSNSDGECPLDFKAFSENKAKFTIVATEAESGRPHYFTKEEIRQDCYDILKASSCIPVVCRPYLVDGAYYFDGGIADPIPYQKALLDGCERLVVVLTRPIDYQKPQQKYLPVIRRALHRFPKAYQAVSVRHELYNQSLKTLKKARQTGKVLIVSPDDCCGIDTLKRNRAALHKLYEKGYRDGAKIKAFIEE